jgi:hypothetical protein
VALGSGRSCANTTAVPDVTMIETALVGGTVVREIICAGLSEYRTRAACSALESTKGCVWGAAGSANLPAAWQGWYSGRKERLRANPQTMDRDPNRHCQLTRRTTMNEPFTDKSPVNAKAGGLCPPDPPRFIALMPIPEKHDRRCPTGEAATETGRRFVQTGRPVSGLGPWRGARVASPRGPVLRPGHWACYPRSARGTTAGARLKRSRVLSLSILAAQPRASLDERNQRLAGRVPGRTESFAFVIRDPGRSFFGGRSIF